MGRILKAVVTMYSRAFGYCVNGITKFADPARITMQGTRTICVKGESGKELKMDDIPVSQFRRDLYSDY